MNQDQARMHRRIRRLAPPTLTLALVAALGLVAAPLGAAAAPPRAALSNCFKSDNGDPNLQTMTHTPASVNVTTGAKTVAFTVGAADTGLPGPASGIHSGFVSMSSADNLKSSFASLTKNTAGKYVGTATIPRWTHGGTWHVTFVSLSDNAGNSGFWDEDGLIALGIGTTVNVTATPDNTAPNMTSFTFTPGSVDTRTASKTVTFSANVTDSQSGVGGVYVSLSEPGTGHSAFAFLAKVAGTTSTYRGTARIARWVTNGTWHVDSVQIFDKVSNGKAFTYDQLGTAGFKRNLTVVSGSEATAPTLASFSRSPATVDVRTANKTISTTMRVKDTGSGVSSVPLSFTSAAGFSTGVFLHRTAGTATDGTWVGSATIQRCLSSGGAWLASITIRDVAGNSRTLDSTALAAKGFPSKVSVLATDHRVPDVTGPSSITPTGNITLSFNENVNGINGSSVTLRKSNFPTDGPILAGTWTCQTGTGTATPCATGTVRKATFDPTVDLVNFTSYVMELNPEHQLAVTDLAGNPFRRDKVFLFTSS